MQGLGSGSPSRSQFRVLKNCSDLVKCSLLQAELLEKRRKTTKADAADALVG